MMKLKIVAAAVSATALGLALATGASAQTSATGCDKLSGKVRNDCMHNTYQTPRPGATTGAGATDSGPVTMSRPAGANTQREDAAPGGALSQGDRSATSRAGTGASTARTDRPTRADGTNNCSSLIGKAHDDCIANARRDSGRGNTYQPGRPGGNAGVGASESGPVMNERAAPGKADTRMNDSTSGGAATK